MKELIMHLPSIIIDTHCHARDMNQLYKTTVEQTMLEAMLSGIGVSVFMPNTSPAITTVAVLNDYISLIKKAMKKFGIRRNQYLYFGLTDNNLDECALALKHPMVVGLKDYPLGKNGKTVTTGTAGVSDSASRLEAMKLVRKHHKVYARHCDNPEVITAMRNQHTVDAEIMDAADTIAIAEKVPGIKVVICHVSCIQSAEMILHAQKEGMRIAIELCPHYLWFDADGTNWRKDIDPVFYKCFNNLRSGDHREFLIYLLKTNNPLVFIGSDNAPHTAYEKLTKQLGGLPSNQEKIAVVCTLARRHRISEKRVAELLSWNAGDFLGIKVPKKFAATKMAWRIDDVEYGINGNIINPWNGSKLLFPIKETE